MSDIQINAERFYQRLERLQTNWLSHKSTVWGGADALCIPMGAVGDDVNYSKSTSVHLYLFGYEFADSLIVITKNNFYFMATAKKCGMLEKDLGGKHESIQLNCLIRTKDEGQNREFFNELANAVRKSGKRLGSLYKSTHEGSFIPSWLGFVDQSQLEKIELAPALGLFLAQKDEAELDLCKRAAVLSNKVMKHGFVQAMETAVENATKVSHDALTQQVEEIIMDPSKISIKVAQDAVDSCYNPIIQSGGHYDIKASALSDKHNLSPDVILCSIGARYKSYCANLSRTFMVDAPAKVEKCYATLVALYDACLEQMIPGNQLKNVVEGARAFLTKRDPELLNHLPKSLGFAIGLEFRDSTMLLNHTNTNTFLAGMVFNLSVGLHNIPLSAEDTAGGTDAIQKLQVFSLLLADVVAVQAEGVPDVLTKHSKDFSDVSYNFNKDDADAAEEEEDDEEKGPRRSGRAADEKAANELSASGRQMKQKGLMEKRIADARKRAAKGELPGVGITVVEDSEASDLKMYRSAAEFPRDLPQNRLKVDMEKECLLVPLYGNLVPFHVSTIKNMTQPDPDMRINFFIPGAMGKEVNKNMQLLVQKYGDRAVFIKELTFRSTDGKNLPTVYQQFQDLRKRVRQREVKAEQEKDLVVQTKLVRIKDQRVPRLQEVTMRPQLSGRKCVGTLEAHQNGLRFTSSKAEILDVMYGNIQHAIYQPCEKTTMVLVHFHLKDFIMVGKKKHKDVQFYSEVVETSENLEQARRSAYDPDELDDEQRERQMRKRLNVNFREFCGMVEKVALHYNFKLNVDVPYKKSGFTGNWSKDMVMLNPTKDCLVNLSEWPPFVLTLSDVEHVHFERVTYATKAFDMVFIFKNWDTTPRMITTIDMKFMDHIQDWLNMVEITYTQGPRNLNWPDVLKGAKQERAYFYDTVDDEGVERSAGWLCLSIEEEDEEEEDADADSNFSEQESGSSSDDSGSDSDDSGEDETESEESDYDAEEVPP
ncbi:FACT complex subunit-domain-containing protein [Ochromonadaceae sp. CCMP2298]|nr:FACT complex subunit-domain-containing protein [Ochromonadaceae sp. CCMP2298]